MKKEFTPDEAEKIGVRIGVSSTKRERNKMEAAIDRVVKPIFEREIAEQGFFAETVGQGFLIAKRRRNSILRSTSPNQ